MQVSSLRLGSLSFADRLYYYYTKLKSFLAYTPAGSALFGLRAAHGAVIWVWKPFAERIGERCNIMLDNASEIWYNVVSH